MQTPQPRGLPPRIYLPVVLAFAVVLVGLVGYFVAQSLGVSGSLFGKAGSGTTVTAAQSGNTSVEGGPPPAVMEKLQALRQEIAAHPKDDVTLTELGDMYLTVGKYAGAIPYYRRALRANPQNVAAKTGLAQALAGLAAQGNQ